jgi:hypothetical protein
VGYDLPRLFPEVKYFESSFEYRSLFLWLQRVSLKYFMKKVHLVGWAL